MMRTLRVWGTMCGLAISLGSASLGQPASEVADSTDRATEGHVSPSDGGLGSTMTYEQLVRQKAEELETVPRLRLKPAGEHLPALAYRFWHPPHALQPGSAQLHFYRAVMMWRELPEDYRVKVESWSDEGNPPAADEREQAVSDLAEVFAEIRKMAQSEDKRWDHRLRDLRGPELFAYLLPDVQQSRSLARLLAIHIDHQVAVGQIDGAIESLRDGFHLARFVGQGETLIHRLVGIAIESFMFDRLEQMLQNEDCPNMYWALATLPRPLVDLKDSIQFELGSVHRVMPVLQEAEESDHEQEYWLSAWAKSLEALQTVVDVPDSKIGLAMISVAATEPARQRLIESGMDADVVRSLPGMRAVLLDATREIRRVADDLEKAYHLPGKLGADIARREELAFEKWLRENQFKSGGAAIIGLLFPAVRAAQTAGIRQEYLLNRLMTIEALRMHAAHHDGELPQALDKLAPVPAFPNPFSGQLFDYSLDNSGGVQTVTLVGEVPESAMHMRKIELRFESSE